MVALFRQHAETSQGFAQVLVRILGDLDDPAAATEQQGLQQVVADYQRLNVRYYINMAFSFLIWVYVLFRLVSAALL